MKILKTAQYNKSLNLSLSCDNHMTPDAVSLINRWVLNGLSLRASIDEVFGKDKLSPDEKEEIVRRLEEKMFKNKNRTKSLIQLRGM